MSVVEDQAILAKLARDVRNSARELEREEILLLVNLYYRVQEHRVAVGNQSLALAKQAKPTEIIDHFHSQLSTIERQVVSALDAWTQADPTAQWARGQMGIGPVLAAAACAYIDVDKADTAGAVWKYFGLD